MTTNITNYTKPGNIALPKRDFKEGDDIEIQLQWIEGIQDQIDFANTEALTDFKLRLKIVRTWSL
jgi:hypothetical protein